MIKIWKGDIADLDVDVVCNAANTHMWMGGGVAGALKLAGGQEIEDEAQESAPVELGEIVITSGYELQADWVYHAATMYGDGKHRSAGTNLAVVAKATVNCLTSALLAGHHSIALPAFGTGVAGMDLKEVAAIMTTIANAGVFAELDITFAVYDDHALEVFEDVAAVAQHG